MTYALDVIAPMTPEEDYPSGAGNGTGSGTENKRHNLAPKFPYQRPAFLKLSDDEVQASADQGVWEGELGGGEEGGVSHQGREG